MYKQLCLPRQCSSYVVRWHMAEGSLVSRRAAALSRVKCLLVQVSPSCRNLCQNTHETWPQQTPSGRLLSCPGVPELELNCVHDCQPRCCYNVQCMMCNVCTPIPIVATKCCRHSTCALLVGCSQTEQLVPSVGLCFKPMRDWLLHKNTTTHAHSTRLGSPKQDA
jgi:hypothetical protein